MILVAATQCLLGWIEAQVGYLAFFRNPESEIKIPLIGRAFVITNAADRFANSQVVSFYVIARDIGQ